MYKLAIFDLDGTILDTLKDLTNSTNYALKKNGYKERTIEEVRSFVGNGIGKLIERALPKETEREVYEKVLRDFTEHYKIHCADYTCAYDGIVELVIKLKERGIKTAVVSNKADFAVKSLCEQYFKGLFEYTVGERTGIKRKPEPDSVYEVMNRLNISKENTVYIGDSEVDIKTANNAGIDIISVDWGFRKKEFLVENGAKVIASNMHELLYDLT